MQCVLCIEEYLCSRRMDTSVQCELCIEEYLCSRYGYQCAVCTVYRGIPV